MNTQMRLFSTFFKLYLANNNRMVFPQYYPHLLKLFDLKGMNAICDLNLRFESVINSFEIFSTVVGALWKTIIKIPLTLNSNAFSKSILQ